MIILELQLFTACEKFTADARAFSERVRTRFIELCHVILAFVSSMK